MISHFHVGDFLFTICNIYVINATYFMLDSNEIMDAVCNGGNNGDQWWKCRLLINKLHKDYIPMITSLSA